MQRFALTLEFDGGPFMGLQRQPHGPTVQQAVEEAVLAITGETVALHAAGRTDAGVHALAMRAHVDVAKDIAAFRMMEALNAMLRPAPIAVTACEIVPDGWHARFTCIGRSYQYRIINRRAPLTVERGFAWHMKRRLDAEKMAEAARHLVGLHDFSTFRDAECQAESPVRNLDQFDIVKTGDIIECHVTAQSFLHRQVRSMVGSLENVGSGKWTAQDLKAALDARDRKACGPVAPPDGLFLMRVDYPEGAA